MVGFGLAGVTFALIPDESRESVGDNRFDHAVVEHRSGFEGTGLPGHTGLLIFEWCSGLGGFRFGRGPGVKFVPIGNVLIVDAGVDSRLMGGNADGEIGVGH